MLILLIFDLSHRFLRSLFPSGVPTGKADIVEILAIGVRPVVCPRILDGPPRELPGIGKMNYYMSENKDKRRLFY